jgi:hypothetical protein
MPFEDFPGIWDYGISSLCGAPSVMILFPVPKALQKLIHGVFSVDQYTVSPVRCQP